ncbi:hypothetical protein [Alicyclobacillus mengziensis]|nr:hypothetical protein [Alicyclobacillus mengziensis]
MNKHFRVALLMLFVMMGIGFFALPGEIPGPGVDVVQVGVS